MNGVATSFAGSIVCSTVVQACDIPVDDRVGTEEITGKCTYVGVTTLSGQSTSPMRV